MTISGCTVALWTKHRHQCRPLTRNRRPAKQSSAAYWFSDFLIRFMKMHQRGCRPKSIAAETETRKMDIALYILAGLLIIGGLAGSVLPALPGIPMVFGGIWLVAAVDDYVHMGIGWLLLIGAFGVCGIAVDFLAASLGAKRVGASPRALWGATLGTLFGMFLGIPGLIFGPFVGAILGELMSGTSVLRSAHVGISTWLGLLFGALLKVVISLVMVGLFGFAMVIG